MSRFSHPFPCPIYIPLWDCRITEEDIHAKFEDGILRLFIPKVSQVAQIEQKNLIAIEG